MWQTGIIIDASTKATLLIALVTRTKTPMFGDIELKYILCNSYMSMELFSLYPLHDHGNVDNRYKVKYNHSSIMSILSFLTRGDRILRNGCTF